MMGLVPLQKEILKISLSLSHTLFLFPFWFAFLFLFLYRYTENRSFEDIEIWGAPSNQEPVHAGTLIMVVLASRIMRK